MDLMRLKKIYDKMQDDESKSIFSQRLLYSISNNYDYIIEMVKQTEMGKMLYQKMSCENKRYVLFGCGIRGKNIYKTFNKTNWFCCTDNKVRGMEGTDLLFMDIKDIADDCENMIFVIAIRYYHEEVKKQLISLGIKEEQILDIEDIMEILRNKQYFDLPQLRINKKEFFVDGGCYDAQTTFNFAKWCDYNYYKILALEPDELSYKKCRSILLDKLQNVNCINAGLWSADGEISFNAEGSEASRIIEDGEGKCTVKKLDNIVCKETEGVTFIKMDIEGAELEALIGAKQTIKKYHPKLAISIYHKQEDIIELPSYILDIDDSYNFYLRHYSLSDNDTVLYAL